jgi:cytochrome c oxidase subunit 2
MSKFRWVISSTVFALVVIAAGAAMAQIGPQPWQLDFRPAATPVQEQIHSFHNLLLVIETVIVLFVLALMLYICIKFNAKANPVPSKTTHHTLLEVAWTVVPIIILVWIAVPSMKLLYFMDKAHDYDMTLKVSGQQWAWSYEYPDEGGLQFDSNIIQEEDLKPGMIRLLEVDNRVVVPADTTIRVLLTATDVLHNWAIPAFGVRIDTVPGRTNETWFRVPSSKIGTYRGQCSELCGVGHGYMPIVINVVSKEDYKQWVVKAKEEFAQNKRQPATVANKSQAIQ